jgi:hypothetical protein
MFTFLLKSFPCQLQTQTQPCFQVYMLTMGKEKGPRFRQGLSAVAVYCMDLNSPPPNCSCSGLPRDDMLSIATMRTELSSCEHCMVWPGYIGAPCLPYSTQVSAGPLAAECRGTMGQSVLTIINLSLFALVNTCIRFSSIRRL